MNRFRHAIASLALAAGACSSAGGTLADANPTPRRNPTMDLGAFSISLAVKDLAASRTFYEKLGFQAVAGEPGQGWLILRNGDCNLGLFQGMLEKNSLTFNPGWSHEATPLAQFADVREIQRRLESQGIRLQTRADESGTGPAFLTLVDPDGNPILIDQHVPAPGRAK